jgi:hypothetical protein
MVARSRSTYADMLAQHTDTGYFWEWPGDTEVLVAVEEAR